ncbi:MAG: coproporphyrinogen III oxidase, partial [Gemmataceae bacterium]
LDRPHDPNAVRNAVALVKAAHLDVSLDLIFGAPEQTSTDWQADLVEAIALGTDHISTYGLTYEKGTPLEKRVRLGMVRPIGEELERTMYSMAMDSLGGAGYEHYEISNFAKPNKRCRHNEIYWANDAHLGFGMGAAGFVGLTRNLNTRELERYIRQCLKGQTLLFSPKPLGHGNGLSRP